MSVAPPLLATQSQRQEVELPPSIREQLAAVARVAGHLSTPEAARKQGYRRIAPPSINDLNHLTGEHWIKEQHLRVDSLDINRPAYLMFYPLNGPNLGLRLVGVAYGVGQVSGAEPPRGFDGDQDVWHVHHACRDVPGLKSILAESADDCESLGGQPGTVQIAMVHVWLDPQNPAGPFALDNPALPFIATGLTSPAASVFDDSERERRTRKLALALGETIGAVPRLGGLIDSPRNPAFAVSAQENRNRIQLLIPELRDAEARHNEKRFDQLADLAIREWEIIRQAYLDAANPDPLRTLIDRWFERSITGTRHAHHR